LEHIFFLFPKGETTVKGILARLQLPRSKAKSDRSDRSLRSKVLRGLEFAVIAAGLLATGVVSAFVTFTMAIRGNEIAVPNLVGSSLGAAGKSLASVELNLRHEGNRFDNDIAPDLVAAQTPGPGTSLKRGRSVRVWTSLGPQRRVIPRIEGESLQSAQLLLEQEGFSLGRVVEVHSEAYAPDSIIAQNPPPYEESGETTEISVLLSRGYVAKAYVMPDFIGREISYVLDRVRGGSLRISSIRYVDYAGVPRGTVVRQTPKAGTKVFNRDRIILYVSRSY
jgi:beta-lactam-binding protein with PASTA domain